jgi:hypothetical protein
MRSPLFYLFGSTSVLLLSTTSAIAPALAGERFVPAHQYPQSAIDSFMQGCMAAQQNADPKLLEQTCYCASQAVQDRYTLQEMLDLSRQIMVNRTVPKGIQEISVGCALAVLKANSRQ